MDEPIEHKALAGRSAPPTQGEAPSMRLPLLDVATEDATDPELVVDDGRLTLVARVGAAGVSRRRRYERIPVVELSRARAGEHMNARDLDGYLPPGLATTFVPGQAEPTQERRAEVPGSEAPNGSGRTIFGTDDRILFNDQSFPWRTTGKVRRAGATGSGTIIGPRHVLTASHVVNWQRDGNGNIGWITFTPGYFDGAGPWGEIAATQVIAWQEVSGPLSDQQTAFDYAILVMAERIGDNLGFAGFRTYDGGWNGGSFWQYVGYPGELSSGERPAFQGGCVVSSVGQETLGGNDGFVLGHFNEFTPGQSGGSAWGWWDGESWPRVIGVGSTIGSTAVQQPTGSTNGDNEYGGGPALSAIISWARSNFP